MWQNSSLVLIIATEMLGRGIKGKRKAIPASQRLGFIRDKEYIGIKMYLKSV